MRGASAYRYFLCLVPDEPVRQEIALIHRRTGQAGKRVPLERLHLSLCVLATPEQRDLSLGPRVEAALGGMRLAACAVQLGRVRGGPRGATLFTRGHRGSLTALRRDLLARLAVFGLEPEQEKTSPHITLGYDRFDGAGFKIALEWTPREIVLIESEHGLGRHNPLGTWPLLPPRQGVLAAWPLLDESDCAGPHAPSRFR